MYTACTSSCLRPLGCFVSTREGVRTGPVWPQEVQARIVAEAPAGGCGALSSVWTHARKCALHGSGARAEHGIAALDRARQIDHRARLCGHRIDCPFLSGGYSLVPLAVRSLARPRPASHAYRREPRARKLIRGTRCQAKPSVARVMELRKCSTRGPNPGADVARGEPSPGADVAMGQAQARCRCGQG